MRPGSAWIIFSVFFSSLEPGTTYSPNPSLSQEVVSEPTVFYRPDRVFVPGRSILEFQVVGGAPLLVNCSSDLVVTDGVDKQLIKINQFFVTIQQSNKKAEKLVMFPTPGLYDVSCTFTNQASKSRYNTEVIVNEPGQPVNLKTNSPVVAGNSIVFTFTFGGMWRDAEKLRLLSYMNREGSKDLLKIKGSSTERLRTKEISLGEFTVREPTGFQMYNGTRIVRFTLNFHFPDGDQKFVELATPVTVLGSINSVTLTIWCECSSHTFYKIDVSIREEYPTTLRIPLGERVYFEDHSLINTASSKWIVDDSRSHVGNLYGLRFESREKHKVSLIKENIFGQFEFVFYLQAYSTFERFMVISTKLCLLREFSKVLTVLTSSMSVENISTAEDFNLTTTVSRVHVEKDLDINALTLITQDNERKCFDMKTYPLEYYVKSAGMKNVKISGGSDRETSYCVWESGRRFSEYGLFTLLSTFSNEIGVSVDKSEVCVSVFANCASPSVRIRKSHSSPSDDSIIVHYQEQDDIYQWCDFIKSNCVVDSRSSGLLYEWIIVKLLEDLSESPNNSEQAVTDEMWAAKKMPGSELFITSYELPVGFYRVTVKASESPYCGDEPIHVTDSVYMKISPQPLRVEIEGGRTSVRYVRSDNTRIVLTSKLFGRPRDVLRDEETSSQAMISQPDIPNYQYLWLCTTFGAEKQFSEYFEQLQKRGFLGNLPASKNAGCFGNGFPVLQEDTTSTSYQNSLNEDIKKMPVDTGTLSVLAFRFVRLPAPYKFRLVVWNEEQDMAYFDHILDLRKTTSSVSSLVDMLARNKSSDVAVLIKCQSNCQEHVKPGQDMRLSAECQNCKMDYNMPLQNEFKWTVTLPDTLTEIMDEIFNWNRDSYNKNGVGSSITLKPSAFSQIGLYTIKVELLARNKRDSAGTMVAWSFYEFHVGQPPVLGTCTVRPSSGIALSTRFELRCSNMSQSTSPFYEMSVLMRRKSISFQEDASLSEDENSYVLYHGPTNLVKDFTLPIGDKTFGFKITLRTRMYNEESFSDYFNYVTVSPPPKTEVSALLHRHILDEIDSALSLAVNREDVDEVARIVLASLSIMDHSLAFQVTDKVLQSLEKIPISSAMRALTTSNIMHRTVKGMLSKTVSINSTLRLEKTLQIEDSLLLLTSKLLNFIRNQERMGKIENIAAIAKSSLSALSNMGQLLSVTDSQGVIYPSKTKSDIIHHEERLYREYQDFLLMTFNSKEPGEDVTEFHTGNAKIAYGKTKLLYKSLEHLEISQSGFKIDKLGHDESSKSTSTSGEIEVSIAKSTFTYDPFSRSPTQAPSNMFSLPVVGITIGKPILRVDKAVKRLSRNFRSRTENKESAINIAKLLSNRTLNVLVPLRSDAVLQSSTSVVLPQPCQTKSQSTGGFSAKANTTSKCGSIMTKVFLDNMSLQSTSHNKGIFWNLIKFKKNILVDYPSPKHLLSLQESSLKLLEETFVVFRSNRACRNPSLPCVKVTFVEQPTSELSDYKHNVSSHATENNCLDDQMIVISDSNCNGAFQVLFTTDLPRAVNKDALDFTEDPWSFPFPATIIRRFRSGVEENRKVLTILLELLQNNPITSGENEILSYMNITTSVISASCKMWNNGNKTWDEDVCGVGHLTAGGMIHCSCRPVPGNNNSTEFKSSNVFEALPILFTADLIAIPNRIDFEDIVAILLRTRTHYHSLFVILLFWILFGFGFVLAWKSDSANTTPRRIRISDNNDPDNSYLYEVVVITGMLRDSGTTAKVTIVLEGDSNVCSQSHVISSAADRSTLQRGARDSFLIATPKSLGQIEKIHIWHDNTGDYPSWHLNRIAVFDLHDSSRTPSYFHANVWLSLDIFPFRCDVVIARTATNELLSFGNVWRMRFTELVETEDIWISTFFRSRYSSFTRVQRLACCAVALFGCILSTLMFYDVTGIEITIGKVTLNLSPIVISLEAAFIMIPVNFVTMNLFRHLAPPLHLPDEIKKEGATSLEVASYYTAQESLTTLHPSVGKEEIDKFGTEEVLDAANVDVDLSNSSSEEDVKVKPQTCLNLKDSEDKKEEGTSVRDEIDEDNESLYYTISEDQFDAYDALQCRAIREIAEAIAKECEYYRSLRNEGNARKRKVFVRVHEIPKLATMGSGDIILNDALFLESENKESTSLNISCFDKLLSALCPGRRDTKPSKKSSKLSLFDVVKQKMLLRQNQTDRRAAHTLDDDLLDYVKTKRRKQKIRRLHGIVYIPKQTYQIPRWVMYIAWTLVVVHVLTCSFITLLYGLSFEKSKFIGWLITFILSLLQNMFVILPLRLVTIAALSTWLGRKKIHLRDWTAFTGVKERTDAVLRWYEIQDHYKENTRPKGDLVIEGQAAAPLTSALEEPFKTKFLHLVKAGKRSLAVRQVQRYLLDASLWIALTFFVTALILIQRDWRLNRIANRVNTHFQKPFKLVKTSGDIFTFLHRDIIPVVHKTHEFSTADQYTLIGPIRLRQLRFKKREDCLCFAKNNTYGPCTCKYPDSKMTSSYYYDSKSYGESWKENVDFQTSYESPWIHRPLDPKKRTYFVLGSHIQRPFYPAGGYIMDLGYSSQEAKSNVAALRHSKWIDKNSAAILIEYSLLNPISGHVTSITYITECLSSGGISNYHHSLSFHPFYIYQLKDIVVILLQLFHLVTIGWLIVSLLSEFAAVRWRPSAMAILCLDMWHLFNILIIIVTLVAYIMYAKYVVSVLQLTKAYHEDPSQFHQFSEAGYYNTLYFNCLSMAAFFSYIRILKVMRGSRIVSVMTDTLIRATVDLGNTTFYIIILVFGFTMLGNFSFGTHVWNFNSFLVSFTSLVSLAAGMDVEHPYHGVTTDPWWSFYFLIFMMFCLAVLTNTYAAILDEAFRYVRRKTQERDFHPVETLAVAWIYEKLSNFFGLKSTAFSGRKLKLREPLVTFFKRNSTEAQNEAMTLDPAEGLPQTKSKSPSRDKVNEA